MLYRIAYLFVFATGFTGLVYQVTWHKYLSFHLGSHAMATSLVLAVFFLFLSLGYSVLGKNIHRIKLKNKLFLYGIIEALIGFYAVISPNIFQVLTAVIPAGSPSVGQNFVLGFITTSLLIGFPTFLMGTTIPVLTQALSRHFEGSHGTHAVVYGLNTLGAVFGAILAGFIFVRTWGLPLTLLNMGLLNIAIGFVTWLIWKWQPNSFVGTTPSEIKEATQTPDEIRWKWVLYGISFASGFYVFSLENLMIRVAGLVLGSSSYTYPIIVAAFITGIAIGSLIISKKERISQRFFFCVQLALLTSATTLYFAITELPEWFARIRIVFQSAYINIPIYWTTVFIAFTFILLVPVALMGMNLPLIFNFLRSRGHFLSQTVGRIYGINTLGSVLGSIVGGYFLFYLFRWDGVFKFNLFLILATLFIFLVLIKSFKDRLLSFLLLGLVGIGILMIPAWDDEKFIPSPALLTSAVPTDFTIQPQVDRLRSSFPVQFSDFGPSAHVGVVDSGGAPQLLINGNPNTDAADYLVRAMNAVYPLSFVDTPEEIFVVGLGGGLSTSIFAQHPAVRNVLVSEIAGGAIKALPFFDVQNEDFTTQPYFGKAEFIAADAINVLRSRDQKYDVIVSEPNHPWVAGVENLFSVEFLTEVRDSLNEGGVYCQWFPLFGVEENTVLTILNTLDSVFPHLRMFSAGTGALSIVASSEPIEADLDRLIRNGEIFAGRFENTPFADPLHILATELASPWQIDQALIDFPIIHSFEFPVIADASFRAKFARQSVSFADSVLARVVSFAPEGESDALLLHESIPETNTLSFIEEALKLTIESPSTHFVNRARVWHKHMQTFEAQPDWISEELHELMMYIGGRSEQFPNNLLPDDFSETDRTLLDEAMRVEVARGLFSIYRQFLNSQVTADIRLVLNEFPQDCTETACTRLKQAVLPYVFGNTHEITRMTQLPPAQDETARLVDAKFTTALDQQ